MNSFLVLPACEEGRGGGHLFRSISLVKSLREKGADAWLYTGLKNNAVKIPQEFLTDEETISQKKWTLVILDRYRTETDEVKRWAAIAPVLGIDEGLSRKDCDFLIDLLPGLPVKDSALQANLCAPSLLDLPKNRRPSFNAHDEKSSVLKILVSFGAEDHAGLTVDTALALKKSGENGFSLSVVLGPLRKNNNNDKKILEQANITVIKNDPGSDFDLKEILVNYDLIITHFGITAFQALHARVPVLLVNPGSYHEKLSRHAGLPSLGISGNFSRRGAENAEINTHRVTVDSYRIIIEKSEKAARLWGLENGEPGEGIKTLSALLLEAKPVVHRHCPLCHAPGSQITDRFPGRTYRLCSCGAIIMDRLGPSNTEYNRDYFFTEYRKQYGKTYLEDFPKLQKIGENRVRVINSIAELKKTGGTPQLLDIGCAYGPFLAAARNGGFDLIGIDPAEDAVNYVKDSLKIKAVQGTFPECLPQLKEETDNRLFDVITLWYVIEHFEEPGKVLAAINGLLKKGGVLAFSTPSAAGISRLKSPRNFLEKSPADHWTIWNPHRTAAILRRYGFRLKKRVITGHHPERFRPAKKTQKNGRFFLAISKIFALGDTFEVYAVKV